MNVLVHPGFDAFYCSFYLQGIAEVFGPWAIRYGRDGFPEFRQPHSLAFLVPPAGRKAFIDAQDSSEINERALRWCDVYAKANVDPARLPGEAGRKILAIGPSFGVRWWGAARAARHAVANYFKSRSELGGGRGPREHFANYWRQYRYRLPLAAYAPGRSMDDYAFFLSALWRDEDECNRFRANFIEACRSVPGIRFEGGFAPGRVSAPPKFEPFLVDRRYALAEYLEKTKASIAAFNTPAVYGCLGWKLAEYLALGKAIITTPLGRSLPAPLVHGVHAHFVDGSIDEITGALVLLARDADYRHGLESHAREYFLEHLAPARCIERIERRVNGGEDAANAAH